MTTATKSPTKTKITIDWKPDGESFYGYHDGNVVAQIEKVGSKVYDVYLSGDNESRGGRKSLKAAQDFAQAEIEANLPDTEEEDAVTKITKGREVMAWSAPREVSVGDDLKITRWTSDCGKYRVGRIYDDRKECNIYCPEVQRVNEKGWMLIGEKQYTKPGDAFNACRDHCSDHMGEEVVSEHDDIVAAEVEKFGEAKVKTPSTRKAREEGDGPGRGGVVGRKVVKYEGYSPCKLLRAMGFYDYDVDRATALVNAIGIPVVGATIRVQLVKGKQLEEMDITKADLKSIEDKYITSTKPSTKPAKKSTKK